MSNSTLSKSSTGKKAEKSMTIKCPGCEEIIPVHIHPSKNGFLIAYHDCAKGGPRSVWEAPSKTFSNKEEVK